MTIIGLDGHPPREQPIQEQVTVTRVDKNEAIIIILGIVRNGNSSNRSSSIRRRRRRRRRRRQ